MDILPKLNLRYFRQLFYTLQFRKHQYLKEEKLLRIQEKRLKAIINHAYHNVHYYHELFDSHRIKPTDINSVKDLKQLPILTKEIVRENYPDKIVTFGVDIAQCHNASTTGSTGMPLDISFDTKGHDKLIAFALYIWSEFGLRLKDKFVTIRHIGFHTDKNVLFQKMRILDWENISIFNSSEDIINRLISCKPDVIYSYPSMLLLLAQEIEKNSITGIKPRLIFTSGESLTDSSRNIIKNVFNTEVYVWYGSEECGTIAFECKEHSGYHVINDSSIIETVSGDKNIGVGEKGEIVITNLFNYTMPLIRYKLGDIVTISNKKCACGRKFPLLNMTEGRTDDYLILPSGRKVSPRVINVIEDIPGVSRYKTVQETKDRIVVSMVKSIEFNRHTIDEIKKHIRAGCLGEDVKVDVKLVEKLPLEGRGKLRAVVSNVKE